MNLESVAEQLNSRLQDLTIYHLIAEQAERIPQAIAIAAPNRTPLTYSRLHAHINEVVKTLNPMGLGRGDRIAIVLPNGPEMAVAFLAVSACATSVPLNQAYLALEFDFNLSDLNAKALIVQSGIELPARAVAQALNIPIIELMPIVEAEAGIFRLTGDLDAPMVSNSFAQPEDVALVLHTSGTTSQPKIVALTQSALCTSAHNIKFLLELHEGDRCLNAMPLSHIYGVSALLSSLSAGASVVFPPNFDLGKFFEWMELNPTWYTAVPSMQQAILTRVENNRKTAAEASLDSITQILAELETFSQEDAQKFLANAKRFKQTLQQQGCNLSEKQVISRRQNLCPAPLSFEQQGLWFLAQLEPDSPLNNVANAVRIHGDVCVAVLQQALDAIVHRHEILRTTFDYLDNCPVQVIAAPQPAEFTLVDLRSLPATEREIKAESLLLKETQKIFNLKQRPLWRVTLLQLDAAEFILLLTNHQIIADRWSIGVFWQELAVLYQAFASSQPSSLSELRVQYADFAHWQRQWLQGEMLQSQLTYWQEQLGGNLPVLELPTDRPRLPIQTFQGARHFLKLPKALTEALKQLSQSEGVTLYMTLLAAFKTLLYRYSGQEDILVGSPSANRKQVEIERLLGCFVNTLVIRTDLSGNPTFRDLLGRVREVALGAYTHQDLPFEKLVEELQLERDTSYSPLFQVMFALQNAPMPSLDMIGLTLSPLEVDSGTAKFDLILNLSEKSEGLSGFFEYNTDLFDAATIARMAGHLQTLLDGILAHPEQRLRELPMLSVAERHQLLVEWNDTEVEYSQDVCIHQLFEATVERTPDKVAVVFENQQLTYGELNQRANQLAGYLKKCGIGTEGFVGICVERSLLMVIGLLAILKAGGTYVPLDPRYPKERIAFVLEDTTAPVLLTQASLVASLPADSAKVVCLDTDWEIVAQQDKENLPGEVTPENLAYVIYTSGSTGKPKGVQVLHRAVVNFLTSMSQQPGLTAQDILLSVTTLSFDIAVLEIFLPLTVGASLVVASPEVAYDGYALQELLLNSDATMMQATPATWRLLLEAGWQGKANLKILCGGEAMPRALASQLRDRVASLWNMYGPTETTIWSTVHQVEEESELISIGRPIANTQIYLMDSYGQPMPIGVPGELHIGGVGLARGYLNRPELTAEQFIHHPYSDQPEARLYKTGDLARYLPDGNIDHLGRIDHQVKIRGFRIELGEIEAVLSKHLAVRETVVLGREDLPGDKRLVAYVVPHQNQTPTIRELRSFLKEKLPEYMVPSAFMILESLPLTPNGKVDRRALPTPELSRPKLGEIFVAPQDTLELQMTKIWEEVLDIQPIGVRDNFFELGGNSLLAVRLFGQIEKIFGKNLRLTALFQAPTIEQLTNILRSSGCDVPIESLVALKLGGNKPPLFCIYGLLLYHDLVHSLELEQPVYGVYLQEEVDLLQVDRLKQLSALTSVTNIASNYLKEIQTLQPKGPYFLAGESFGGLVAFEMAQQLHMQGEKVALLALFDTESPVSIKKMPWRERVSLHFRNLLQEDSTHIQKKVNQRISSIKDRLISRIYSKFGPRSGQILPSFLTEVAQRDIRQQFYHQAFRNYVPRPYLGKVILFRAMNRDQFEAYDPDPQFGWGKLAAGGLEVHHVPGDHIGILEQPHVRVLARRLRACLEQAQVDDLTFNREKPNSEESCT